MVAFLSMEPPSYQTFISNRCYAFQGQALESFKKSGGFEELVKKVNLASKAIGGTAGGISLAGGAFVIAFFLGLATGPVGIALWTASGLLIGGLGGIGGGHMVAKKVLKGKEEYQVWRQEEVKKETIKAIEELFQKYVSEDPFLKRIRCSLSGKIMFTPTIIVGRPERYDLTSLFDENGDFAIEHASLEQCKPDRLLTVLIQHRLLNLLNRTVGQEMLEEQLKGWLTDYRDDLGKRQEEAIEHLRKELADTHEIQRQLFDESPFEEECRKLSRLLLRCRTLEFEQLIGLEAEKSHPERRRLLLTEFKKLQKVLIPAKLEKGLAEHIHQMEGDIAQLLEIEERVERSSLAQEFEKQWMDLITTKHEEEDKLLAPYRTLQLGFEMGRIDLRMLLSEHAELRKKDEDIKNPTVLCYLNANADKNEQLEGADWHRLSELDHRLLNLFECRSPEHKQISQPNRQVMGSIAKAFAELRQRLERVALQEGELEARVVYFDNDFIKYRRRNVDISFEDGDAFPVRPGMSMGHRLLGALDEFSGEDWPLHRALQVCLSQCGSSAFKIAAVPQLHCGDVEELSTSIRRLSETEVEVTIAGRSTIAEQEICVAHQRLTITFTLVKTEKRWRLDAARVDEREAPQWVIDIPSLPSKEGEDVKTKSLTYYIQRKKPFPNDKTLNALYMKTEKVESAKNSLEELKAEGIDEALEKASFSPLKQLKRMIEKATKRDIRKITLEDERRVLTVDNGQLVVTKLGEGKVIFVGDETLYFPYREKGGDLSPVYLCGKPIKQRI